MKSDRGGLILEGLPLPPSSNNQYKSFVRRGRIIHVRSPELVKYRQDFDRWALENAHGLGVATDLLGVGACEVEAFFGFSRDRLFTMAGGFKRLDVSNYLKAVHDCLATKLGVDDCAFFSVVAEKFAVDDPAKEQVIVRISPFQPRNLADLEIVML